MRVDALRANGATRQQELQVEGGLERDWARWYVPAALVIDLVVASVAALAALLLRFGSGASPAYALTCIVFPFIWVGFAAGHRLYESRFLGSGVEEFRRLSSAGLHLMAVIAVLAYSTKTELARGYVALVLPLVLLLNMGSRYALRRWLQHLRRKGRCMQRVVAVGHLADVAQLVDHLAREPYHGLQVVGACLPDKGQPETLLARGIPTVGGFDNVTRTVELCRADTVAVVSSPEMSGEALRRLAWKLEATDTDLIVAPGLVEVAGPRLSIRPAAGLSLLHVEPTVFAGGRRIIKGIVDRGTAAFALLVISPLLVTIAVAVAVTSSGPVIYRQRRVGVGGREFTMYKFRTMVADADARREALLGLNEHDGVLFKIRKDPRITRVGGVLRRYSLDELPQLFNILTGQMSLVGPRPSLPSEVAAYPQDAHRRLLVKPGLTGLWQVSGRADLSWEESMRLDLRYVDNWSLAMDAMVVWKTARAVLRGSGAY